MIKIKAATSTFDYECITQLARVIWHEHYPSIISSEQIDYMLEAFNSLKAIEEQVTDSVLFYYITFNELPVGYLAYKMEANFVFIRKLYLLKAYRGKGIAKVVIGFIESVTRSSNLKSIRLYVNKFNSNSILAYEKMGFIKIKSMMTAIGEGYVMDDFEMEKTL